MRRFIGLVFAALLAAGAAQAQESALYGDIGYQHVQGDTLGGEVASYGLVTGHLGYDFSRHFGVELEAATGVVDEEADLYEEGVDSSFGLFARLKVPVSNSTEIFARAGFSQTTFSGRYDDGFTEITYEVEDTGEAFGFGVNHLLAGNTGFRLEYTRYNFDIEGLDVNADSAMLSLYHRF